MGRVACSFSGRLRSGAMVEKAQAPLHQGLPKVGAIIGRVEYQVDEDRASKCTAPAFRRDRK